MAESIRGRTEYAPDGNTADSTDSFRINCEWKSADHESVNLDLDYLDFKSSKPFLKKNSPDQNSGFRFIGKEREILFKMENPFLDTP